MRVGVLDSAGVDVLVVVGGGVYGVGVRVTVGINVFVGVLVGSGVLVIVAVWVGAGSEV